MSNIIDLKNRKNWLNISDDRKHYWGPATFSPRLVVEDENGNEITDQHKRDEYFKERAKRLENVSIEEIRERGL